jgi:pimeloyl-ACP methyl ester carboxylesterase
VLGKGPIVFFGQSIGGAVAINLAADNPSVPAALILENTFTSITDLIPSLAPPLASFTWLLHQKWDSRSRFLELPADLPILLLSGRKDEIVPSKHMDEVRSLARAAWSIVAPGR